MVFPLQSRGRLSFNNLHIRKLYRNPMTELLKEVNIFDLIMTRAPGVKMAILTELYLYQYMHVNKIIDEI